MAYAGNYESFADYRDRVTGANIDTRPTSVILAELQSVEAEFANKKEAGTNGS